MLVYATADDLAEYTGQPEPANAETLLRAASRQVRWATRLARYTTDADGFPADAELRAVFTEATVAQVSDWVELGITPSTAAAPQQRVQSKSEGGRSVTFAPDSADATQRRAAQAQGIISGTEAWTILADAGLLSTGPWQ